jgi:hypothetical protein
MRQIMPHRNNIRLQPIKCKVFRRLDIEIAESATFLPQRGAAGFGLCCKFLMGNNALHVLYSLTERLRSTNRHG